MVSKGGSEESQKFLLPVEHIAHWARAARLGRRGRTFAATSVTLLETEPGKALAILNANFLTVPGADLRLCDARISTSPGAKEGRGEKHNHIIT